MKPEQLAFGGEQPVIDLLSEVFKLIATDLSLIIDYLNLTENLGIKPEFSNEVKLFQVVKPFVSLQMENEAVQLLMNSGFTKLSQTAQQTQLKQILQTMGF